MIVTPVVNVPSAARNAWGSKLMFWIAMTGLMEWNFRMASIGRLQAQNIVSTD
jgi:hypothetical protein